MKKGLILGLLVAGGSAAYYLLKRLELKVSENDDITFVKIEDDEEEVGYSADVNEISELYPYLSKKFIEKVYGQTDKLEADYPDDTLVEIKHYASFGVDTDVKAFVTLMDEKAYEVSYVGEEEKDVILVKKFFSEKGRIVSEIFNVANQVNLIGGIYTGYEVLEQ
ncbi:MAG: hypothetical protein WBH68_07010 [Erysipelotrichaceae bacterium]|jgi:hypothetical protein|nr:hypothetical protein [Bacillota bacterium]NLP21600.1 hypothetical protein [Erysipelotrichaceae bacterium]HCY06413.1 hypothetical protein [Erysipelotrichaceae bacterium]